VIALLPLLASLPLVAAALAAAASAPAQKPKPNAEKSIQAGLAWLARHQNKNGSWGGPSLAKQCTEGKSCYDARADVNDHYGEGLTGLALLCFLRAGYDDQTDKALADPLTGKPIAARDVVGAGLKWLKKTQTKAGSFGRSIPHVYNDSIGTMAMAEAFAATKSAAWKECATKGVSYMVGAQRPNPDDEALWGWRYASRQLIEEEKPKRTTTEQGAEAWRKELYDADTSATGWAVAALWSGIRAGIEVPDATMKGALDFLNDVSRTDGMVGYLKAEEAGEKVTGPFDTFDYHPSTLAAIAVLIRSSTTRDTSNRFLDLNAQQVLKDMPRVTSDNLSVDYYYWYHGTQALNRIEGTEGASKKKRKLADPWNKAVLEALTALQDRTKDACSQGGWVTADRWSLYAGGPVYSTTMGVLSIEAIVEKDKKK